MPGIYTDNPAYVVILLIVTGHVILIQLKQTHFKIIAKHYYYLHDLCLCHTEGSLEGRLV